MKVHCTFEQIVQTFKLDLTMMYQMIKCFSFYRFNIISCLSKTQLGANFAVILPHTTAYKPHADKTHQCGICAQRTAWLSKLSIEFTVDHINQEIKISNDQELENPNQNPALKIKMGIMQTDCKQSLRIEIIRVLNKQGYFLKSLMGSHISLLVLSL